MNKWLIPAVAAVALLSGCSTVQRGSIPVVDSGTAVSNSERISANGGFRQTTVKRPAQAQRTTQAIPQGDTGVVVMVPGWRRSHLGADQHLADHAGPDYSGPIDTSPVQSAPINQGSYSMPSTPSGIPSAQRWRSVSRRAAGWSGAGVADHCSAATGRRRPQRCFVQSGACPARRAA